MEMMTEEAAPKRSTRGYRVRDDLAKALKRIAVEEEKPLYLVMEAALDDYITRWKEQQSSGG